MRQEILNVNNAYGKIYGDGGDPSAEHASGDEGTDAMEAEATVAEVPTDVPVTPTVLNEDDEVEPEVDEDEVEDTEDQD